MNDIDSSAVQRELEKILASSVFASSPRMTRFLRFVVEETLSGNGARIKEYVIALEVFGKPESYDPQADSTVRTEASKLRTRLGRYYDSDGREDPVVISIPKGSYAAAFEERNGSAAARAIAAPAVNPPAVPARAAFPWLKLSALAVAVVVTVASGILWFARPSPSPAPQLVPLTSYPELEEQPSLSPDGSRVAFRWKGDIYVKDVGSEALLQVTKDPAPDSWPAWSPNGSQIAFVRNGEVWVVSPLGGGERKVAESAGRVAWMPDGSLLVLEMTSQYCRSVFRVSLINGKKQRLTFPDDLSPGDEYMSVSPDGQRIAVSRDMNLYLVPTAGGPARRLTNDQRGILGSAWTADGREIVFASNRDGVFRLWRVLARPERSGVFQTPVLVEGASDGARLPSISHSNLAYERFGRNFDIRQAEIVGPEGAASHRLLASVPLIVSTRRDSGPSWSPDGGKIAFISDRSGTPEVWICESDGSNALKLTSLSVQNVALPRWSPDGGRLTFSANTGPDGNFVGYVVDARGGPPERIRAPGHKTMAHPIFSHDGRWLYFIPGAKDGAVEAFRMPAAGGEEVQITKSGKNGAFRPEEVHGRLYFAKIDAAGIGAGGLWSVPVTGGEESQILDSVAVNNWTVTPKGIYYFDFAVPRHASKLVKFYSFQTGRINQVGTVEPTVSPRDYTGISVSPDGRLLLYSDVTGATADLMLLHHFR